MQSILKELLDKIYELEGLVHLALKREEDTEDFMRLIAKKTKEVGELSNSFINSEANSIKSEDSLDVSSNFVLEEYSLDEDKNSLADYTLLPELLGKGESERKEEKLDKPAEIQKGKLVFTINERFRFRRELFDNSDADFNNTLALIASMENFDEAEEYFINEEGFDPSNEVVKEFMDVIKRYFK